MRYRQKIFYEWNADLAYVVGLFASDGCLVNNGRHLNITSKDWEIVATVMSILNKNVKVGTKTSSYGGEAYQFQFSDVSLYDFLLKAGLTPAKSKTIAKLNMPKKFYRDFLIGEFDGDGTVYGYWDKRWPNSLMYYSGLVSASRPFLEWMKEMNNKLIGVDGRIRNSGNIEFLVYAKKESRKLFEFMYKDKNAPRLGRKYYKFKAFLEEDPYGIMTPDARVL